MRNTVTRAWKVYGRDGLRQSQSFGKSVWWDFSTENDVRIISVLRYDITNTHDYAIIIISRNTVEECWNELHGQLSDGIFENSYTGAIEEIGIENN